MDTKTEASELSLETLGEDEDGETGASETTGASKSGKTTEKQARKQKEASGRKDGGDWSSEGALEMCIRLAFFSLAAYMACHILMTYVTSGSCAARGAPRGMHGGSPCRSPSCYCAEWARLTSAGSAVAQAPRRWFNSLFS